MLEQYISFEKLEKVNIANKNDRYFTCWIFDFPRALSKIKPIDQILEKTNIKSHIKERTTEKPASRNTKNFPSAKFLRIFSRNKIH